MLRMPFIAFCVAKSMLIWFLDWDGDRASIGVLHHAMAANARQQVRSACIHQNEQGP